MSAPKEMPWGVATVRRDICKRCPTPCVHQHNADHYAAPCSQCPLTPRRWGHYGRCEASAPAAMPAAANVLIEPTVAELAANFAGAMERWVTAGAPVVSKEQYAARSAACESCQFWDGAARFGLGKCNAPGCGCTKFKRWLATEQCKHPAGSRWPDLTTERPSGGSN